MAATSASKTKLNQTGSDVQFDENLRYQGSVKLFKESGYGFLRIPQHPDVFFHIKDLQRLGLKTVNIGDRFTFKTKSQVRDSKIVYSAYSLERYSKLDGSIGQKAEESIYPGGSRSQNAHKSGHSGSLVAIPHPRDIYHSKKAHGLEVAPQNGEIVVKNVSSAKSSETNSFGKKPKPIDLKPSMIKIGPACKVNPLQRGPVSVSATGPDSAEMAPKPENPKIENLKEAIEKKKTIFRSLNLEKLPDGGRRLRDDINSLEIQLQDLMVKEKTRSETELDSQINSRGGKENALPVPTKLGAESKPMLKSSVGGWSFPWFQQNREKRSATKGSAQATDVSEDRKLVQSKLGFANAESLGTKTAMSEFAMYEPMHFADAPLYGGRMTTARLTEVRKVTKAAIEDLHRSLATKPEPDGELDDPSGLKVSLMLHQKQALAWLIWREAQTMSGGILADDMGLGKTLTMISLLLKQRESEEGNVKAIEKEEYNIQDFNSSTDSRDSDVIVIEDKNENKKQEDAGSNLKTGNTTKDVSEANNTLVESQSTLIVAPASLLFHWEKEIRNRCNKGLLSIHLFHGAAREKEPTRLAEFDVVITTYDIVRKCASAKDKGSKEESTLMEISWRRIILDEAHHIKNFKSQSSEAVCKLEAKTRWAMSGTPVQNNLTDMYAMLKFLHCRPFDEYKVWKNQVDNKTQNGKERLKTLISCIVLRREKSSSGSSGKPLVDLPERTFMTHKLKLSDVEREVYEKLQSDSKAAFRKFQENKKGSTTAMNHVTVYSHSASSSSKEASVTATTLLVMLLRLRQCCGHLSLLKESFDPELLNNEKKELALEDMLQSLDINKTPVKMADINAESFVDTDKKKYFTKSSLSGKLEFVLDELNKLRFEKPDDKCVIISQWTSMLEVIAHHLDKSHISYAIIKGSVSAKKRMDMVDEFNRNTARPMVMLLSLQAGGVGLNLVGGNHLYLLDMHWNPALESQAFDRIYRVGQKKAVFVHKFVMENTVEERILKLQEHKLSLARAVMEGVGSEECKKLTLQDMKLLFGI